jgi:hypothetical protein
MAVEVVAVLAQMAVALLLPVAGQDQLVLLELQAEVDLPTLGAVVEEEVAAAVMAERAAPAS